MNARQISQYSRQRNVLTTSRVRQTITFGPWAVLCLASLVVLAWAAAVEAQEQGGGKSPGIHGQPAATDKDTADSSCRQCHTCDRPTPANLCLVNPCRRQEAAEEAARHEFGPDMLIMDELEGSYLPVPFDHLGHARMAEMADGCVSCHHHTPEGESPPACKSCHEVDADGTDIFKPGLKGAYHQQCLNCHREWIDERDCDVCHRAKAGQTTERIRASASRDDFIGRMHPPIPEPATDIYRAETKGADDSKVVFRHGEHVNRFGLNCVDCHHEPSCGRCHASKPSEELTSKSAEHHRPCIYCHKDDMDLAARAEEKCEGCHWEPGQPEPKPFDHAATGWPLAGYHQRVNCRTCHVDPPFKALDAHCSNCHKAWDASTFDHTVTGQALDENHADVDCQDCHEEGRFDRPPTCSECHDEEDDGIAFPAKRPGRFVGP